MHEEAAAHRSAAVTIAAEIDEEGLLSGWVGNALVCASLPPIIVSLSTLSGKPSPHLRNLIVVWVTLAVLMQLWGMISYFGSSNRLWKWRDFLLLAILLLAFVAYLFLALSTIS